MTGPNSEQQFSTKKLNRREFLGLTWKAAATAAGLKLGLGSVSPAAAQEITPNSQSTTAKEGDPYRWQPIEWTQLSDFQRDQFANSLGLIVSDPSNPSTAQRAYEAFSSSLHDGSTNVPAKMIVTTELGLAMQEKPGQVKITMLRGDEIVVDRADFIPVSGSSSMLYPMKPDEANLMIAPPTERHPKPESIPPEFEVGDYAGVVSDTGTLTVYQCKEKVGSGNDEQMILELVPNLNQATSKSNQNDKMGLNITDLGRPLLPLKVEGSKVAFLVDDGSRPVVIAEVIKVGKAGDDLSDHDRRFTTITVQRPGSSVMAY